MAQLAYRSAGFCGRPVRPLHLQALLNAPRLADDDGEADIESVEDLLEDLARETPVESAWQGPAVSSPRDLAFREIDAETAAGITARFHYLRSPRSDGKAFGLIDVQSGAVGALCVVSPLDVTHLRTLLEGRGRSPDTAAVLSRVFSFTGMPKNSLSFLLARAAAAIRHQGIEDLVTYVNPNMGFTGVSYAASGWTCIGHEPGTTYRYLDGRYITDRELVARHGQHRDPDLRAILGDRFAISAMPLQPLKVFWRHLQ